MRTRTRLTLIIVTAMVALGVPTGPPAQALTLGQIQARIKVLNSSLAKVAYQLSDADDHLVYLRTQIAQHYTALRTANARRAQLQQALGARAAQLYVLAGQGSPDSLASDGLATYVQRMTYLEQIGYTQEGLLEELRALQADAKTESATLAAEENDAQKTVNVYAARRAILNSQLAELTKLNAFLESVMRPDKDEAAIVSFTGEVTLEQGLTGNIGRLRRAIDDVRFVPPAGYIGGNVVLGGTPPISGTQQTLAGSTAIWDAIWATSNELLSDAAEHTRRAIILLTDGQDTISQVRMQEAINRALKADALIYAIGIGDRYEFGIDEGALKKLTENTGGRAFFPRNERDLNEAFAQIQRDLRERYLIAYSPSNKGRDGSYRRITIEIVNPEVRKDNLKLNYRPGYFAKTPVPETSPNAKKP